LRDAVEMEWAGIPAAVVIHEALAGSADAMKQISRMPNYPYVIVGASLPAVGTWTDQETDAICDELLPQIVELLTNPVPGP